MSAVDKRNYRQELRRDIVTALFSNSQMPVDVGSIDSIIDFADKITDALLKRESFDCMCDYGENHPPQCPAYNYKKVPK